MSSVSVEAYNTVNEVIDYILQQFSSQIKQKYIGNCFAPKIVNKQTSHTLYSLVALQSNCIQLSDELNPINSIRKIDKDSLLSYSTAIRPDYQPTKFSTSQRSNQKSKHTKKSSDVSQLYGQNLSKITQRNKNQQKTEKFKQLLQDEGSQNAELETEIEAAKARKFFLDDKKNKEKILIQEKMYKTRQNFMNKITKLKKMNKFSFDYDGEPMEAKNNNNSKIKVNQIKSDFIVQASRQASKQASREASKKLTKLSNIQSSKIVTLKIGKALDNQENSELQDIRSSIKTSHKMIGKSIDPVTQIDDDALSEGIKISNTSICKQKFRKRVESRLKTLHEYRQQTKEQNFKEYTIKSIIKSRSKTLSQANDFPNLQYNKSIKLQRHSQTVDLKPSQQKQRQEDKRIKSQNISFHNSRIRNSILYNTTLKNETHGKIKIDNVDLFEKICVSK